jgi:hypothetical protein
MASKQFTNKLYWAVVIVGNETPGSIDHKTVTGALEMATLDCYDSGIKSIYPDISDILGAYDVRGGQHSLELSSVLMMDRAEADAIMRNTTSLA